MPSASAAVVPATQATDAGSLALAATSVTPAVPPLEPGAFARLFADLSEPSGRYFSTNYVTNETSYLQVADQLEQEVQPGGAYLGVGPEQNFTYIALTQPQLAFILDIRRQNALLHLLYKAIFDVARSRTQQRTRTYDA